MTVSEAYTILQSCKASMFVQGMPISTALETEGMMLLLDKQSLPECIENHKKTLKTSGHPSNLWGITEEAELKDAEKTLIFLRLIFLEKSPAPVLFENDCLKLIHLGLYENILADCGVFRTTNTSYRGHEHTIFEYIPKNLAQLLGRLEKMCGAFFTKEEFAERLVHFFHEMNILHPFREGDGLVLRHYFRNFSKKIGFELDYGQTHPVEFRQAMDRSFMADEFRELYEQIFRCLRYIPKRS